VVVGGSLAGLRAAEAVRREGYGGPITVVGAEPHPPYDRPPLSKGFQIRPLAAAAGTGIRWRLGTAAAGLDVAAREVVLSSGERLPYDGLVIATGARARRPSGVLAGALTVRTRNDALALRASVGPGRHVLVVGTGFLGNEVAATARRLGAEVTLVGPGRQPLADAVGQVAGEFVAAAHRAAGVRVHNCAVVVERARRRVLLSDGSALDADVVVAAIGADPETEWLAGSGLMLDRGVVVDLYGRALRADGSALENVVAAGDVTRFPHPLAGGELVSLGHWTNAEEQASAVAHTLVHPGDRYPYLAVPSFWSDVHDLALRSVGLPGRADEQRVHEHDLAAGRLEITYHCAGRLVGALTVNRVGRLAAHRRVLQAAVEAVRAARREDALDVA
jgi:NADPH-dependent 2,4-dienoyl-CoA reductase/sulfur reductase-like enzyme